MLCKQHRAHKLAYKCVHCHSGRCVHTRTRAHTHTHTNAQIHMLACKHAHLKVRTCAHARTNSYTHAHVKVHSYTHLHKRIHMCHLHSLQSCRNFRCLEMCFPWKWGGLLACLAEHRYTFSLRLFQGTHKQTHTHTHTHTVLLNADRHIMQQTLCAVDMMRYHDCTGTERHDSNMFAWMYVPYVISYRSCLGMARTVYIHRI
jgi:hypothetical protein